MAKTNNKQLAKTFEAPLKDRAVLCLASVAIVMAAAHLTDLSKSIMAQLDHPVDGPVKVADHPDHIHAGDILLDRRHIARYSDEERSTSERDRDNWEVYENVMAAA